MSPSLTWHDVIGQEKEQPYFKDTLAYVAAERRAGKTIYPPQKDIFNAFRLTELDQVKSSFWGKIRITAPTRLMDYHFRFYLVFLPPLHWGIYTRNWSLIFQDSSALTTVFYKAGPSKAFYYLIRS